MAITGGYVVKWKGTQIGDHAFIVFSYSSNNDVRIIPRAKGVKIWSTNELGGGHLVISVNAVVAKDNRYTLESYFRTLDTTFSLTVKGDLTVLDRYSNAYTLSDCYLQSFSQGNEDLKVCTFNMEFIKSL